MIKNVIYNKNDVSVLISADSDLIPPIDFIREFNPRHKIFVHFPPDRFSYDLKNKATNSIYLAHHYDRFANSTLHEEIILLNGHKIYRPPSWK